MNPVCSPARHDLGAKLGFAAYGVIHRMTGLGGRVDERLGCMEMMLSAILAGIIELARALGSCCNCSIHLRYHHRLSLVASWAT